MYILQYLSVDGQWYDQTGLMVDDLDVAKSLFDSLALNRGAEWLVRHRIVERRDRVVYPAPRDIDPAQQGGA